MEQYYLLLSLVVTGLIYVAPWIIGICRNVQRSWLIFLVNVLTGWTILGWVVCLIWAVVGRTSVDQAYVRYDTGWQPEEKSSLFRPESE